MLDSFIIKLAELVEPLRKNSDHCKGSVGENRRLNILLGQFLSSSCGGCTSHDSRTGGAVNRAPGEVFS
jgi:hypothetical protein